MDFQIPVAPGAPVDAAFENSLEALESRLRTLKSDVLGTIRGHFDQFSKSFQCVNHLQSKVVSVSDHLKELAAGVGDAQLSVGPFEAAALESTIRQRLNAHEAMLNSLKVLAEVHELFVSFDALLESGDYVRACGSVDRVSALVGSFSPDVCGDSRVLVCVRNQGRKQRSRLRARLAELCARAVAVEGGEVRVSKEVSGVFGHMHYEGVTPLPTLLRCAASVGLLDETMRTLAGKLKSQLLPPILAGTHDVKVSDSKKSSTLCCVPVEKPSSARGVTPSFASSAAVFQRVGLLFTFLSDVLFREVPDLVESLGTPLWWGVPSESSPSSSSALGAPSLTSLECTADISAFLSLAESTEGGCVHSLVQLLHASLPGSLQELKAYGAVTSAAKELEASLVSRRCIGVSPPSHAGGSGLHSALATFGADVHTRFVYKRRQVVLGEARDICANEYHNSTPVPDVVHLISSTGLSGVSTLPAPDPEGIAAACASDVNVEKFQVSETVIRVLQLVHDTLKEACELPPGCVSVLYDTARDVVDVFRAVVPALFGPIIKSVPRLAMLFHNDCLFLGQRLGSVGQQYRSRLPPPLSSMASMADLVPAFRRLAEDTFVTQIKRQLVEITTTGPPPDLTLDDLVRREVFEEVEAGVKRQLYHLSQLAAQWSAVLQPRIFRSAFGRLLQTMMDFFLSKLKKRRLTDVLARHIRYLLSLMLEAEQYFGSTTKDDALHYVPCWDKVKRLVALLEKDSVNNVVLSMILDS